MDEFRFIPMSPDGFPFDPDDTFATEQEAWDAIKNIYCKRYETQGYYSSNRGRISLEDLPAHCTVISYNATDEEE